MQVHQSVDGGGARTCYHGSGAVDAASEWVMLIVAAIGRAFIGALFGVGCFMMLLPLLVGLFATSQTTIIQPLFWAVVAICALSGVVGLSARRAFGLGLLEFGLCSLTLPLSIGLFINVISAAVATQAASDKGFAALRDILASGLLTWVAAIVACTIAGICLVSAYFLLRRDRGAAPIPAATIDTSRWSKSDREAYERQQARRG